MAMQHRYPYVDTAKALGITLVVLGHAAGMPPRVVDVIFSFHMPLFFLLSGFLVSERKLTSRFGDFARKQLRVLGVPYLVFFMLSYAYWLATARIGPKAAKFADVAWYGPLKGLFTGIGHDLFVNEALWFFPGLLVTSLLYHAVRRWMSIEPATILLIVIGYLASCLLNDPASRIPLDLDIALPALSFYALGCWTRNRATRLLDAPLAPHHAILWLLLLTPPFTALALANRPVDMNEMHFGVGPLLFIPIAVLGIGWLIVIAKALPESRLTRWLADNTLVIFPSHALVLNFLSGVVKILFGVAATDLVPPLLWAFLSSALALAAALPLSMILGRLIPASFARTRPTTPQASYASPGK